MVLVLGVVFFNILMVADVIRQVPRRLLEVSSTLGAGPGVLIRKVILPHALPGIIDAARVNAAAAWNFLVIAELFAATSGLGYRIIRSQRFLQTDRILAVLIVIGVIGIVMDVALRLLGEPPRPGAESEGDLLAAAAVGRVRFGRAAGRQGR